MTTPSFSRLLPLTALAAWAALAVPCPAQNIARATAVAAGTAPTASGNAPAPASSAAAMAAAVPANYALSPNDLVEVKVFQEEDMDWTVRVTKDGTVNLPLVGTVNVLHKTPDELGEIVKTKLHDGYLVHPQVSVAVMEYSKRRFTLLGEVNKPGQIDFPDNSDLNLLEAIGIGGGYTKSANASRVYVKRLVGNKEIVLTVDANRMARRQEAPFHILPGDTITVAETPF